MIFGVAVAIFPFLDLAVAAFDHGGDIVKGQPFGSEQLFHRPHRGEHFAVVFRAQLAEQLGDAFGDRLIQRAHDASRSNFPSSSPTHVQPGHCWRANNLEKGPVAECFDAPVDLIRLA